MLGPVGLLASGKTDGLEEPGLEGQAPGEEDGVSPAESSGAHGPVERGGQEGIAGRKAPGGPAWRVPECPRCRVPRPAPWPARGAQGGGHRADDVQAGRDRFSAARLSSLTPGRERGACGPGELRPCLDLRGGGPLGWGAGLTQGEAECQGCVGELQALLGRLHLSQQRRQLVAEPQLGLPAPRGHRQGQCPVLRGQRAGQASSSRNRQPGPCPPEGPWVCPREPPGASRARSLQACLTLVAPWTLARQAPLSMGFSGKNTGGGCHALLQGVFLAQGPNPRLLHLLPGTRRRVRCR